MGIQLPNQPVQVIQQTPMNDTQVVGLMAAIIWKRGDLTTREDAVEFAVSMAYDLLAEAHVQAQSGLFQRLVAAHKRALDAVASES